MDHSVSQYDPTLDRVVPIHSRISPVRRDIESVLIKMLVENQLAHLVPKINHFHIAEALSYAN
jgi:hypothetical protein